MKYLIYTRVSTDMQDIKTQEHECMKLIKPGEQYQIHIDEDVRSGVPMEKRFALQEMLFNLDPGDTVLVYNTDRLSRNLIEMISIYEKIKEADCHLVSVTQPGIDNELVIGMMGVFAQHEKTSIRKRIKAKSRALKDAGERYGPLPYGYDVDPNLVRTTKKRNGILVTKPYKLVENPKEQVILKLMIEMYHQGLSYKEITDSLNANGYRNRSGGPWHKTTVWKILKRYAATSRDQLQMVA